LLQLPPVSKSPKIRLKVWLKLSHEAEVLSAARRFDENALAEVYDAYSTGIYRFAYRQLGQVDLAEECTAETFHRLLRALEKGKGPHSNLRAYLYRVAHNWITDYFRNPYQASTEIPPDLEDREIEKPESSTERRDLAETLREALSELTDNQRQVIVMRYLEGWNTKDIAVAMQKPVGAVKALQHRGLAALRRHLPEDLLEL
jgi:RNA polymerase sigma-70 factor (ECF subfamily)